jgi:hypothetical protein
MPTISAPARLALELAALGWHILPLSPASKRPLGNCAACSTWHGNLGHQADTCPCLAADGWCHGVRAATTDLARISAWWRHEPAAVPGVAAGPSGLILVDIDAHGGQHPPLLATGLLPGIDLAAEPTRAVRGRTRPHSATVATASPCWPGSAAAPGPGHPGRSISPSSLRPHQAACTCGTGHPPTGSARPSATPKDATGWPGQSTSKPAGHTASPPARPLPPAPTRYAAATPPGPAACPPGSPPRSSA